MFIQIDQQTNRGSKSMVQAEPLGISGNLNDEGQN